MELLVLAACLTTVYFWWMVYDSVLCCFVCILVKKLFNAGASPDCSNEDGLTVLHQVFDLILW